MTTVGLPATEIAALVRSGEVSPRAVVAEHLARITALDPALGAFRHVRTEGALAEADALGRRRDLADLPLAGVPVAVKDNVPVAGEALRDGSAATSSHPQPTDHEVVRRLRSAGAVVVGLTAVPELCVFGATDSVFGLTRNPWDPARSPGGSSGGSAAAVAAGLVPVAHGNDGMGSVRIPAACCGLVGLKPGYGTVPAGIGNGDWYGLAENGVLATTVADAAAMFAVLAGSPAAGIDATLVAGRCLTVALSLRPPVLGARLDPAWAAAAHDTATALSQAGDEVRDQDPPYALSVALDAFAHWTAGTAADAEGLAGLERRVRVHAGLGRVAERTGLRRPDARARWRARLEESLRGVDLVLTPALASGPLRAVRWSDRSWLANVVADSRYAPYAAPWNLAGWPALVVPAGVGPDGLPLAVQLVGRPGNERMLPRRRVGIRRRRRPRHSPATPQTARVRPGHCARRVSTAGLLAEAQHGRGGRCSPAGS